MRNRHDPQDVVVHEIDDAIREPGDAFGTDDRVTVPARPDCPSARCVCALVYRAQYVVFEPVAHAKLALVVPVDVRIELGPSGRVPANAQASCLLASGVTSLAAFGELGQHDFMRNHLDLAVEDLIDA